MVSLASAFALAPAAESYRAAGLCVLPARLKEKFPALPGWKQYQKALPQPEQVAEWFGSPSAQAVCIVTGAVSGNAELLDFDCQAEVFDRWRELVEAEAPGLVDRLLIERSQSAGKHTVYRTQTAVPGSAKLAEKVCIAPSGEPVVYKGKRYVPRLVNGRWEYYPALVETKGEGGLFLCAPSPGYVLEQGSFEELPVITEAEREILIRCARSFNERIEMAPVPAMPAASVPGDRPGDDFNARGDIRDLLLRHQWTCVRSGDNEYWRRPGKDHAWSATFNGQVLYNFSASAAPFEPDRGYSKFQVYALLEHNGDHSAAASALRAQGYGGSSAGSASPPAALPPIKPTFKSVRQLLVEYPELRPPVIHGLLREGETANIIAPPKTGKSWLVNDLAIAVATGRPWLSTFDTVQGNVLVIDNELHHQTSANRIPRVAQARNVPVAQIADTLFVENLRGQLRDLIALGPYFEAIEPGTFRMIVLDAFYRFLPKDTDENDNGSLAMLYNHLDYHAARLGCCFVLIHHASKGSQANKAVTDIGAGAGSQARATDSHLVLRAHEEDRVVVFDGAVRSWPPVDPLCLRWDFPVFNPVTGLDPTALRPERPRRKPREKPADEQKPKAQAAQWDAAAFTKTCVTEEGQVRDVILDIAVRQGLSKSRAKALLQVAESEGKVHRWTYGANRPAKYATVPQPLIDVPKTQKGRS